MKRGLFMPTNTAQENTSPVSSNARIKVDLHVHTCYSEDAFTSLEDVVTAAMRRGLGAVAITDHNAIRGALELSRSTPFPIIVGEEVFTSEGEISGLFLHELIPPGLTPAETVARIKAQGGVVYIPHPFDALRDSTLHESALLEIVDQVEALEVLNARVLQSAYNARARSFAQSHGLACGAGSDAHTPFEIGQAYVEMEPFVDRDGFLRSLARARVGGSLSAPHVHLFSTLARIQKRGGF
jgi:hypothetical protein